MIAPDRALVVYYFKKNDGPPTIEGTILKSGVTSRPGLPRWRTGVRQPVGASGVPGAGRTEKRSAAHPIRIPTMDRNTTPSPMWASRSAPPQ